MQGAIINLSYVVAAALFIFGLKGLSHPRTAVRGNLLGALGMLLAIVVTLFDQQIISYNFIIMGLAAGSIIGVILAVRVQMTGMPQMVALLNGFGGAASTLVAGAALIEATLPGLHPDLQVTIATGISGLIGAVTLTGSLIAFGKLQGIVSEKSIGFPGLQVFNALVGLVCVGLVVMIVIDPSNHMYYWILVGVASLFGITLTLPIGGADMPVVIALLNSYSGLAAAATGFVLNNNVLIVAGSLVGASGLILTNIMCVAMNRSLTNVLFAVMGPTGDTPSADDVYGGKVKSASAEEVAMLFDDAEFAIIVPGYGMAVSQAQHAVRDLTNLLESRGCTVEFAIHPVAGRMPGHMNVLLAESDISYDKLKEMDEINPRFPEADVALVLGANDVVNPVARTDPSSPIAGMPILDVDKARTCVVIKRSLSAGFAGIPNPLFAADNTLMYFADGKKAILDLISALKEG